jgi:aspartyl protease family protein
LASTVAFRKYAKADLIVDTGSSLTWVKRTRLGTTGVKPRWEKEFRTIEGRVIRRATAPAVVCYDGSEAAIEVVFAEGGDAEVLGVTALESLGYQVDPVTNRLNRTGLLAL